MNGKKLKSIFAKIATVLAIVISAVLIVFLIGRYGWKLRGFSACESAGIDRVTVTDSQVEIVGFDPSPFPAGFLGWHAEEQDGKLYVGFKFSSLFGIFETGDFDITIPTEGQIREVYIKTGQSEYLIWSMEEAAQ